MGVYLFVYNISLFFVMKLAQSNLQYSAQLNYTFPWRQDTAVMNRVLSNISACASVKFDVYLSCNCNRKCQDYVYV